MVNLLQPGQDPKALVQTLTSYLMHKHYCENDVEALVALFDPEDFFWLGAAEQEYAAGSRQVTECVRNFRTWRNLTEAEGSCGNPKKLEFPRVLRRQKRKKRGNT